MRHQKPIIKSVELVPGRDDDIIEYLAGDLVNASSAIRAGLRLLISKESGGQEVIDLLLEIRDMVGSKPKSKQQPAIADPFLNQSL